MTRRAGGSSLRIDTMSGRYRSTCLMKDTMTGSKLVLIAFAMVVLLLPLGLRVTLAQKTSISSNQYAGVEVCAECHRGESTQFRKTSHAKSPRSESQVSTGCEACHGP